MFHAGSMAFGCKQVSIRIAGNFKTAVIGVEVVCGVVGVFGTRLSLFLTSLGQGFGAVPGALEFFRKSLRTALTQTPREESWKTG